MKHYQKLKLIFRRHSQLQYLQRILQWDEAVMMPEGAGRTRADAVATLTQLTQKTITKKQIEFLLKDAKQENLSLWDSANLGWMEKIYKRSVCVPIPLVGKLTKANMAAEQAWRKYRAENNWKDFLPFLKKSFGLIRETAEIKAEALHLSPYDALLDEYAPGFSQKQIMDVFEPLKDTLPDFCKKVMGSQANEKLFMPLPPFSVTKQKAVGEIIMKALGFDFTRGRLDVSHHPFCSGGPNDVRMTTHYSEEEFQTALLAICHETGHALYEQGLPKKWQEQPVGKVDNMAMHESQSLLIEMEVCRSKSFCEYLSPLLNTQFGNQAAFSSENLARLFTRVKPGLIRIYADEINYPLHVILRFEIEKGLFANEIQIDELPEVWDVLMLKYLGISPEDNYADGVMQDVHWPAGLYGYFPAYTLGRLIAAQLFESYLKFNPEHHDQIKVGDCSILKDWLSKNVYLNASLFDVDTLLKNVTRESLNVSFFLNRLKERYLYQNH